ncbi:S-layer homology domain-containing protein [Paenibacillus endoradicis]|uniref:S-layer homology domain-containing protein n=1 Tax=Paenibacillus endoradicis TaxID=2972487 RepID=UPI002158F13A|nr:S-layer homology domain-containing protein [Paenibacillus endoradicis]MCR8660582.1 S-layer homology domain-containing protein [Paenibacillus endoradicis]
MKDNLRRLVLTTVAIICATSIFFQYISADEVLPFDDISTSYAKKEIIHLYNNKIISGTSKTSFSPTKTITRAEFITILDRLLKLDPAEGPITSFTDVAKNDWYFGWIQAAVQLELASGRTATTFAPKEAVTRQEAAVWIARALKKSNSTASDVTAYKDSRQIADWASSSVTVLNKLALMKGDETGYFRPSDPITREETAVLIDRVLQNTQWAAELKGKSKEHIVIGWQYGQTVAEYERNIQKSNVNTLSPRWYFVGETGTVTDKTEASLVTWAKNNDKQIWAMVGNRSDQEATHKMLSSATARIAAVNQLVAVVTKYGLDGLNLDFENVHSDDRTYLTTFVTLLAQKLHGVNAVLSMDVSPDLGTDWTEAFDYASLGKQVDYMVMMGYDQHYDGSKYPGPNASLPYIQNAIHTLLKVVSNDKVILAMPLYNRDWTLKQDGTVSSSEYISLIKQNQLISTYSLKPVWNKTFGQYVATYKKDSVQHSLWLEDSRSLIAKYKFVVSKNLAGVAYWYIGGESSDLWTSMRNAEKYFDYSFK